MDCFRVARHRPLGIEISVEMTARLDTIEHLYAADLDYAIAPACIQSRGFGVEDDFPHSVNLFTSGQAKAIENVPHLGLSCG